MKVEYKKDLRHNYMVISEWENGDIESYSIKILKYQSIEGILSVEQRRLDNRSLLYYDITAKQSMAVIYEKASLSKDIVQQVCTGIIDTLERAYDYLLSEDNFVLMPEYIYIEVASGNPILCFLPGYNKGIKEQMSSLMEYLMNKVDYNDREAVLLVYQLYAVSREDGYTFDHLKQELNASLNIKRDIYEASKENSESINEMTDDYLDQPEHEMIKSEIYNNKLESSENRSEYSIDNNGINMKRPESYINKTKSSKQNFLKNEKLQPQLNIDNKIPVMMEKLEGEEEIYCYPFITYVITGVCIAAGVLLIILGLATKILYNSFGNRIDCVKLAALLLIVFCVEGYMLKFIWDKKNRITKMVTKNEYVDPRQEFNQYGQRSFINIKEKDVKEIPIEQRSNKQRDLKSGKSRETMDIDSIMSNVRKDNNKLDFDKQERYKEERYKEERYKQDNYKKENYRQENCRQENYKQECNNQGCYKPEKSDRDFNSEKKPYDNSDNQTCLLNGSSYEKLDDSESKFSAECVLIAIDKEQYQSILISDFPFFIGKLKKNVDYCLEKDGISRYHAKITKEEGRYYITDLNSTNGTFLNGESLQTYEKKEVNENDEIAFANIKYVLQIKLQ